MSTVTNPIQDLDKTIKNLEPKVKTTEQRKLISRAKEVSAMVKGIPLDDITARMIRLATTDLATRLKHLK